MSTGGSLFGNIEATSADSRGQLRVTVDVDQARRAREATSVQLRKSKKEERLNRRRKLGGVPGSAGEANVPASAINPEKIPEMVNGIMTNDTATQEKFAMLFRRLLSIERNPPIDMVIKAGVVPRFVEFLQRDDSPTLQFEAAWALTNIASGTSNHTAVVINSGAVPIFVSLLASTSDEVREQAVWALGNVAGDSAGCRDLVLQHNAIGALLAQLKENSKVSMLRNATWTLSNFCRGKPPPNFNLVKQALPSLATLVFMSDREVLTDACWALSYMSDGTNDKIQAVIDAKVVPRCVELLQHPEVSVQTPALRTVGNIVTGDDKQTQVVLQTNALSYLKILLGSHKKGIRKEACWTLSNITAGNAEQIQAVVVADIFPTLISMLTTEQFEIQKEAAWAVSNATAGGNVQQVLYLVEKGCVKPLCELLDVPDSRIVMVALEGIENVLKTGAKQAETQGTENLVARYVEEAGGLNFIEKLQTHRDKAVWQKSSNILTQFYSSEVEETGIAPTENESAQQFSFGVNNNKGNMDTNQGFNFGGGFN